MPNTAPQRRTKTASETRNVAVSFVDVLDVGELLTGTPTVVEVTSTDLTLTNKAVNGSSLVVNDVTCLAGQVVTFTVAGGVAGTDYQIRITATSNAGNAQTLQATVRLRVTAD
jgi:hypothetical protein